MIAHTMLYHPSRLDSCDGFPTPEMRLSIIGQEAAIRLDSMAIEELFDCPSH